MTDYFKEYGYTQQELIRMISDACDALVLLDDYSNAENLDIVETILRREWKI